MRRSLIISGVAHAVVLGCGVVAFAARPNDAPPTEPLPVEFISSTDFTQLTNGVKNAPKPVQDAKPLAEKTGEPKPVKELAPKIVDKPEVRTDAAPQPKPEAKAETKAAEKIEKPEPKPKDTKPKTDQIAEALKKEEVKKPAKKPPEFKPDQIAEELKKDEAKKSRPSPKFDADQVAALLDKRDPQRQLASAETLNGAASLGAPSGHAAQLSVSEMDALRRRLSECWNPPAGIDTNSNLYVVLQSSVQARRFARERAGRRRRFGIGIGSRACRERQARVAGVSALHDAETASITNVEGHFCELQSARTARSIIGQFPSL